MYKQVATAVILTSVCLAPAAFAHDHFGEHCKVEIRQNVEITPDSIRITAEDRTLVQIDHDQRLFVSGDEVPLDLWQQSLITDYSQRIRSTLPMVVDVLLEGVELGAMATSEVFFGITGRELPEPVTEAITDMRRKVERKMKVEEDRIVIQAGHPHDDLFEDLHPELESAIASSMEALIKTVGRSILSGEGAWLSNEIAWLSNESPKLFARK